MRIQSLLLPLTVLIAVGASFAAGHYIARHDAGKATRSAVALIQAEHAAETFKLTNSARLALMGSKPEQATQLLTTWAALQAPALMQCHTSPACAAWMGSSLPSQAQLDELLAAERTLPTQPATR
jgi:hypothetical protein